MPKWVKIIKPLFDFLAINPGYNEVDASGVVTVFFSLFFGILIGDAGYGLLFLLISLFACFKFKSNPEALAPCKLIVFLSLSAIVWGALTSNYFGVELFKGVPALTNVATKDKYTQIICFALGVLHMSSGHFWKMIIDCRVRNVFSQIGWMLIMVGNFILINRMLVEPGPYPKFMLYCFGIGIVLIGICEVEWLDAASVFSFPFGIINSFVDLLSYIRLYAVGVAGYYLAVSFNDMAHSVMSSGFVGVLGAIFILLIGHLLNIALAILAVLVHGVRLNTLEFSSHIGLQWTGYAYKPFKNLIKNK